MNFRVVTEKEFFAALHADPRNIMPSVRNPEFSLWETSNRTVWGKTTPGWRDGGDPNVPKVYMLALAGPDDDRR